MHKGLNAKIRTLALGGLIFLYMCLALFSTGKSSLDFTNFFNLFFLVLISAITACTYIYVSPISWNLTLDKSLWLRSIISFLACLGWVILYTSLIMTLVKFLGHGSTSFYRNFRFNLSVHLIPLVGLGYIISYWQQSEKAKKALEQDLVVTQALLMYSQLSPHSLFNALNTISQLVPTTLPDLNESILALARYLQGLIRATDKQRSPLHEEKSIIEDYLKFETYQKKLRIVWNWDEKLDYVHLPPLLLQPLVENAVKYGTEGEVICIICEHTPEGDIRLATKNVATVAALRLEKVGVICKNVKSRLNLTYGSKARFSLSYDDAWVTAEILISKEGLATTASLLPIPKILRHNSI